MNNKNVTEVLSRQIDNFLSVHWKNTVLKFSESDSITLNKRAVKSILEIVNFVRLQKYSEKYKAR